MAKKSSSTRPKAKKTTVAKSKTVVKQRRLKQTDYKSFKRSKKITPAGRKPIAGSFRLLGRALKLLANHWKLFLTIVGIYGLLSIIMVRGIGGGLDLSSLKASLKSGINGNYSQLATGTMLFGYLIGSSGGSASPTAGVYQTLLVIVMTLVVIWALRQVIAGHKIRARDAFYKGTYPLVQFSLVLLVVSLQLLPLLLGAWVYGLVANNSIAITSIERLLWMILFILLSLLSLYMVTSSVFALYIVTLPNMTPLKALRSARALVKHRRMTVLRKVLFLPMAILVLGAAIMIPLILILTPLAEWIFFGLSMASLVVANSYMYLLYRELL